MFERVLAELHRKRDAFALDNLRKPRERSSYEFGRIAGVTEGLDKAIETIEQVMRDLIDEDEVR